MAKALSSLLFIFLLGSLCTSLLGCHSQSSPSFEPWQTKIINAFGDETVLTQISSLVFSGKIATRTEQGTISLVLDRSRKLRATMNYGSHYEDRILVEDKGWRNFGEGFTQVAGPSLAAMVFQYKHLDFPSLVYGRGYKVVCLEFREQDKSCAMFSVSDEEGLSLQGTINPETGLVDRVEAEITMGPQKVKMGVGYSDYRPVSGVMLPHRIVNYVNGVAIASSSFDSVQVNKALELDMFIPEPVRRDLPK